MKSSYLLTGLLGVFAVAACAPTVQSSAGTAVSTADAYQPPDLPAPRPLSREEYAARRAAVAASMQEGVFVAIGSVEPELDYLPYAQNASFRYLTGVLEPGASLIITKTGSRVDEILFVQPRDPSQEVWEGARLGPDGVSALTGIPSRTSDQLVAVLDSLLARHSTLYVLSPAPDSDQDAILTREQQILGMALEEHAGTTVTSLSPVVEELRAQKSEIELDYIRRAVQISTLAVREAMKSLQPGMNEFEIHALIEYVFRRNGSERPAFGSIVASGPNSTTLHYRDADRFIEDDELLLMDVGASYRGYAADVSRTIPVDGSFDPDQLAVYEIVLEAQKAAEQRLRAGATWNDANAAANLVLATGLAELGLIDAPTATYDCEQPQTNNRCSQLRLYYMHALGHGVGLEVHDPDVSYFGPFEAGSAITLEPGIYVRDDVLQYLPDTQGNRAIIERLGPAVERYAGIGVRIEDLYIVTGSGTERVSSGIPREPSEIETLMTQPGLAQQLRRPEMVDWYRGTEPE